VLATTRVAARLPALSRKVLATTRVGTLIN
jgi:hypothetical protein